MFYTSFSHLSEQVVQSKWVLIFDNIEPFIKLLKVDASRIVIQTSRISVETDLQHCNSQGVNSTFGIEPVQVLSDALTLNQSITYSSSGDKNMSSVSLSRSLIMSTFGLVRKRLLSAIFTIGV